MSLKDSDVSAVISALATLFTSIGAFFLGAWRTKNKEINDARNELQKAEDELNKARRNYSSELEQSYSVAQNALLKRFDFIEKRCLQLEEENQVLKNRIVGLENRIRDLMDK